MIQTPLLGFDPHTHYIRLLQMFKILFPPFHLCFADDIDSLAGEEEELKNSVEHLDKVSTAYGMEISAEKTS